MFARLQRLVLLGVLCNFTALADPVAQIPENKITYVGITVGSVEHFKNIKFAHEASGVRRFAPPDPYTPPHGAKVNASVPGSACPQIKDAILPFISETKGISEDCLNLRIARPAGTNSKNKLPVVVWVHTGGVVKGSAYDPHFDPDKLVKRSVSLGNPIIYVAINYRLTIFGFARLPLLKAQNSLNVGMRDQRAGFQWVKDNIATFGGDPERITAFGLSAGGTSISLHLMSYGGTRGVPFTQAWVMSGPPGTALNMSSDATTIHTMAVAEKLGCGNEDEDALLQCLRSMPMESLLETAIEYSVSNHPPAGLFTFIPSVDDDFFPDRQSALYRAGKFVKGVPLVLGWTQDDGALNGGPAQLYQTEDDIIPPIRKFAHALDSEDLATLFSLYDPGDFEEDLRNYEATKAVDDPPVSVHYFRISRILRDLLFSCSSIDFAFHMDKYTKQANLSFAGVRLYDLNQSMLRPLWKGAGSPYVGVAHGSDTNYIFNGVFPEGEVSEADEALSKEFSEAFITFAYTGGPARTNSQIESTWSGAFTQDLDKTTQSNFTGVYVQVVGGPYGTGGTRLGSDPSARNSTGAQFAYDERRYKYAFPDKLEMRPMQSATSHLRNRELNREKLLQRCEFINSLAEKLGI